MEDPLILFTWNWRRKMGLKKASACFLAMEKRAIEDGLFVDYEAITATESYSAVTCTVSEKQGTRRIVRMASDKELSIAQQCAGYMALCAFYGKDMEEEEKGSGGRTEGGPPPAQTERKDPSGSGTGGAAASNTRVAASLPNTATDKSRKTENMAGAAGSFPKDGEKSRQQPPKPDGWEADDFQVPVGKYKNRKDNWISDMVKSTDGRKTLSMLCDVTNPSDNMKEIVMLAKDYIKRHNINLRE